MKIKWILVLILLYSLGIAQRTTEYQFPAESSFVNNRTSAVSIGGNIITATSYDQGILILELTTQDQIVNIKKIDLGISVVVRDVCISLDGCIHISGYGIESGIFILKMDKDFNLIWANQYGIGIVYYIGSMSVNKDGVLNLVGAEKYATPYQAPISIIINPCGDILNFSSIDVLGSDTEILYGSMALNSDFILTGVSSIGSDQKYALWLMRVDLFGRTIWSKYYIQNEVDFDRGLYANGILDLGNSEFLLCGRKGDDEFGNNRHFKEMNSFLCRFNSGGELIQFKLFKSISTNFNNVYTLTKSNHSIYGVGYTGLVGDGIILCKYDQNLDIIRAITNKPNNGGYFIRDIEFVDDKIFCSGGIKLGANQGSCWFGRIDSNLTTFCSWKTIDLKAEPYIPNQMNFTEKFTPSEARCHNLKVNIEDLTYTTYLSSCNSLDKLTLINHLIFRKEVVQFSGINDYYSNKDNLVSLVGKTSPIGGEIYFEGVKTSSINPGLLIENKDYTLDYFYPSKNNCFESCSKKFKVISK
ncbi:MAG TPA: hypothetical protein PK006_06255 [Saprospiraceae bacterium]|nr:hypothetical protein [Saprospiraceae bacterium]